MNRWTAACLLAAFACSAPLSTAHAQIGTRAYAPENLRQLSRADRSRVIAQEYADQANGRRIPDDQMRFYLDQIDSGWGFSRIKQDIATSLGSRPGGGWQGRPPAGGTGGVVKCESRDNRERVCQTGWRSARLVRQISGSECIEGQSWGTRGGSIWVTRGCRAEFVEGRGHGGRPGGGWGGGHSNYTVTCSSNDRRRSTCAWEARQGRPVLIEQLSGTDCVEGRTWGLDGNSLWVSGGCRARFGVR